MIRKGWKETVIIQWYSKQWEHAKSMKLNSVYKQGAVGKKINIATRFHICLPFTLATSTTLIITSVGQFPSHFPHKIDLYHIKTKLSPQLLFLSLCFHKKSSPLNFLNIYQSPIPFCNLTDHLFPFPLIFSFLLLLLYVP